MTTSTSLETAAIARVSVPARAAAEGEYLSFRIGAGEYGIDILRVLRTARRGICAVDIGRGVVNGVTPSIGADELQAVRKAASQLIRQAMVIRGAVGLVRRDRGLVEASRRISGHIFAAVCEGRSQSD